MWHEKYGDKRLSTVNIGKGMFELYECYFCSVIGNRGVNRSFTPLACASACTVCVLFNCTWF